MTSFPPIQTTDSGTSQYMIIPGGYIGTEAVQVNGLNYLVMIPGNTAHTIQRQVQAAGVSDFLRPEQASREADKLSPAQPPMPETDNEPAGLNIKRKTDETRHELSGQVSRPAVDRMSQSPAKQKCPIPNWWRYKFLSEDELIKLKKELNQPEDKRKSDTELAILFNQKETTIRRHRENLGISTNPAKKKKCVFLQPQEELDLTEELENVYGDFLSKQAEQELSQRFGQTMSAINDRWRRMKRSPEMVLELKKKLRIAIKLGNEFKMRMNDGSTTKSLKLLAKEYNLSEKAVEKRWERFKKKAQIKPAEPAKSVPETTAKGAAKPEVVQFNDFDYEVKKPEETPHTNQRQDQAAGVSDSRRPEKASREADKLSPAQPPMPETDNEEPAGLKRKPDDKQDELSKPEEPPKRRRKFLSGQELKELFKDFSMPKNERLSNAELSEKYGQAESTIRKRRGKFENFKTTASKRKCMYLPPEKKSDLTQENEFKEMTAVPAKSAPVSVIFDNRAAEPAKSAPVSVIFDNRAAEPAKSVPETTAKGAAMTGVPSWMRVMFGSWKSDSETTAKGAAEPTK